MDFFRITEQSTKSGVIEIYPVFKVGRSKDLMVRSKSFYAIWDEKNNLWSTDEYDVVRLVDDELRNYAADLRKRTEAQIHVKYMDNFNSGSWMKFRTFVGNISDSVKELDENLTFSNTEVKKGDYVSRCLPYPLAPGDITSWDEIIGTLYEPEERAKIEWAIGAIVSGDSKKIQKFLVFYGAPGTGKGTIIDIIQRLFEGYWETFDGKALTGNGGFAAEAFKNNPLIAIDPDGDMSKVADNSKLNSIVSHEPMSINEKFKSQYTIRLRTFLIMATNKPVKITDAKSGIIRRMIDVHPSEARLSPRRYQTLMSQVGFELGAIAHHCLEVYRQMGRDYYSGYEPIEMMLQTNVFFNFIEAYYDVFKAQDGVALQQAYEMWKVFKVEAGIEYDMPLHKFRVELANYFHAFDDRITIDGVRIRSWFSGFNADKFKTPVNKDEPKAFSLVMDETESLLDLLYMDQPAQYSNKAGTPNKKWAEVTTKLSEIDTSKEHYVKPIKNHIVIDFDLTDVDGNKSAERNLQAASTWPSTYAEYSKSGAGVHLHYIWDGDVSELNRLYDEGIEVKVFTGDSSLRRRLSKCNNVPVATINTGLPLKEKKVLNADSVKSERSLRELIERNLRKEIMPGTKPSIDFIHKILEDAYNKGELSYDLTDMRGKIMAFGNNSSHHGEYCMRRVVDMKFRSKEEVSDKVHVEQAPPPKDDRLVFFDVEVFPNLFIISWKYQGSPNVVRMVNPSAHEVGELTRHKLVGFNNRRYDNHILYGAYLGYNNEQLYNLSQKIINGAPGAMFGEAYNLSHADIYDFSSKKQGLKKFQIELGLNHSELGLPWDEPVAEELWGKVGEYCDNDVITTEQVFEDRKQDYVARQILAQLSGLSVNDPTQKHTAAIVFEGKRNVQSEFKYTDLSKMFKGYTFELGKSYYKGELIGEGGLVRAKPGMYTNVGLLDVVSMHPTSIHNLDLFGPYTKNFWALVQARVAIKNKDYDAAKKMLGGVLEPYLQNPGDAKALSYALKIVINIVYGLTSAKFDNPFRDPRNKDNIVAKRGALFMVDLMEAVAEQGYEVVHIKTDSIKIAEMDDKIKQFVIDFGKKYGYDFEHEATYEKMCLVNDAVYVAKVGWAVDESKIGTWETVGTQFQIPFVKKTLFTREPITFRDKTVEKHVTSSMYLDFTTVEEGLLEPYSNDDKLHFIGKGGLFCPIIPGNGGGQLVREKDGKYSAVTGTKGWYWLEADMVETLGKEKHIDTAYFEALVNEAYNALSKWGDTEWFLA